MDQARPRADGLLVQLLAPVPDQVNRAGRVVQHGRPACVRVAGPLGGATQWDAARCRSEAARLVDAARALEAAERAATTDDQPSLFDEAVTA